MRISDWSSDVCSSDLVHQIILLHGKREVVVFQRVATSDGSIIIELHCRKYPIDRVLFHFGNRKFPSEPCLDLGKKHEFTQFPYDVRRSVELGRASCREGVCRSVTIRGGAVELKNK